MNDEIRVEFVTETADLIAAKMRFIKTHNDNEKFVNDAIVMIKKELDKLQASLKSDVLTFGDALEKGLV